MELGIMERIAKAASDVEDERRPAEVLTLGRAEQAALRAVGTEVGFSADTPLVGFLYGMRIRLVDEPTRLSVGPEDEATQATQAGQR